VSSEKWTAFWKEHGQVSKSSSMQEQVLRTYNKQAVSETVWSNTLQYITDHLELQTDDVVLDLCCGNGLISQYIAPECSKVVSVDVTPEFVDSLSKLDLPNVETVCANVSQLEFPKGSFSIIIIYAGIQYFSLAEVVSLFKKFAYWLKPGGRLFIGDIPDISRTWSFYNSPEREAFYFESCENNNDVVGTWFDKQWLLKLSEYAGFSHTFAIEQPMEQIYSHFRFDFKATKK
jgi:cyclopropane fatty-acyl-phospholipid synthase-like methyltransferase